ncbi:unnamed protein product [Rhizoctonia solani]|uniref:Uncharacterized protein n=1 Tax=Rhizoctonia solani TaxID=456999 RepID=A0A8H2XCU2_9AGAM|nr:unnamed protein product [Rhizoctonia solani]
MSTSSTTNDTSNHQSASTAHTPGPAGTKHNPIDVDAKKGKRHYSGHPPGRTGKKAPNKILVAKDFDSESE